MAKRTPKRAVSLGQEGRLVYLCGVSATIVAVTPSGMFKLLKIVFANDGSIFLPFPYLETKRGILSEGDPASEPDPKTLNLRRNGVVVEYDVKFSHHISGVVHFSKTLPKGEEHDVLPRRQGFRLDGPIGRVFDFQGFNIHGFDRFAKPSQIKDVPVVLKFPKSHPSGIVIWGEWLRKQDVQNNLEEGDGTIGPYPSVQHRATGRTGPAAFLSAPAGNPASTHLLMVSAAEVESLPSGVDKPTAIFWGGWDQHEGHPPATAKRLVFMYPYDGPAS